MNEQEQKATLVDFTELLRKRDAKPLPQLPPMSDDDLEEFYNQEPLTREELEEYATHCD